MTPLRARTLALLLLLAPAARAAVPPKKVSLDLFVMSLCPYGTKAEDAILPVVKQFGDAVDFHLHFIGGDDKAKSPRFRSLHGAQEVAENIRQVCAIKQDRNKAWDYILKRNRNLAASAWKQAATEAGLDVASLERCGSGSQGEALYAQDLTAAVAKNIGGSPTIQIDGQPYDGGRGQRAIAQSLCGAMKKRGLEPAPACASAGALPDAATLADACAAGADAAPAVPFTIEIVRDSACKSCRLTLVDTLKGLYPAATFRYYEGSSKAGQARMARVGAKTLPLYILEKKVEQTADFLSMLDSYYARAGDSYVIRPGPATYTPTVRPERPLEPRHLDVFIEGLSPASLQAQAELFRYLSQSTIKDLTLSLHFIVQEAVVASSTATAQAPVVAARAASLDELRAGAPEEQRPLTAAGGSDEVQENLRLACLFQHENLSALYAYLQCRSARPADAGRSKECLKPSEAVKGCVEGEEGAQLLRVDARASRELGLSGGPALVWENRYGPFPWAEVDWKKMLGAPAGK